MTTKFAAMCGCGFYFGTDNINITAAEDAPELMSKAKYAIEKGVGGVPFIVAIGEHHATRTHHVVEFRGELRPEKPKPVITPEQRDARQRNMHGRVYKQ